jgi:Fe(3+) dicitrate transport protein
MNNLKSVLCLLSFVLMVQANAQTFNITGFVRDSLNKSVANAILILSPGNKVANTNNSGEYEFDNVPSGNYTMNCYAFGKSMQMVAIQVQNQSVRRDFKLMDLSKNLDAFEVEAERQKSNGLTRMRSVEDFAIYEGKKSEVIVMDQVQANLATNNARQVYAKVTGLNIWESDGSGLQLGIGGRGLNPNRTASFNVRQNGYDISADALGYPESYYTPPTEALEKIEVIRGAASLQYGTQFGGLLNFRFKKGAFNKKAELTSRQSFGSWNFFNSFNSIGGTVANGRLNYYGFVQYKRGDGYRENSGFEQVTTYTSMIFDLTDSWKFQLDITKMHYLAQQPGGMTDKNFEKDARISYRDRNWFTVDWNLASLQISHRFNSRTELNIRNFGLLASRTSLGNLERINVVDFGGNRTMIDGQFKNIGNETRLIHRYHIGNQLQVLALGARVYQGNTTSKQGDASNGSDADFRFLNPNDVENSDYRFPNKNAALFAEHIIRVSEGFTLTPGIRYEYVSTSSNGYFNSYVYDAAGNLISKISTPSNETRTRQFFLAGLGLNKSIGSKSNLYANFSQNYRAINFSDLYVVNPNYIVDPNIKDETGYTADIGIRGSVKNRFNYEFTGFYIKYNGKIGQVLKSGIAPLYNDFRFRSNIADARNIGIESFMEYAIIRSDTNKTDVDWNVYSNFAYVNARYVNTQDASIRNKQVEMVPPVIWRLGTDFRYKKFKFNVMYSYTHQHFSDASNAILTATAVEGIIPSYSVIDLGLRYDWKRFSFQLSVNNLLNEQYFTRRAESYPGPGIIPSDGRGFYGTIQIKL